MLFGHFAGVGVIGESLGEMSTMTSVMRFAHSIGIWLAEARLAWLLVGALGAALLCGFWPPTSEQRVRFAGWFLEICGLMTVAWGLRETRRQFGRPGLGFLLRSWWDRRPRFRARVVAGSASISLGAALASGRGYTWREAPKNASVEERLGALEANVKDVSDRVNAALRELDEEVRSRADALKSERSQRERAIADLQTKMESVETGGLSLSAIGLVWLAVGLTMTTVPAELIAMLQ